MPSTEYVSRRNLLALSAGGGLLSQSLLRGIPAAQATAISNEPGTELALEPGWLLRWQDGNVLLERDMHVLIRGDRIEAVQKNRFQRQSLGCRWTTAC